LSGYKNDGIVAKVGFVCRCEHTSVSMWHGGVKENKVRAVFATWLRHALAISSEY
jgi:hypothetical protein